MRDDAAVQGRWDVLAERTVTDLLCIRNMGEHTVRSLVAASIDRAVVAMLPAALLPQRTLSSGLDELPEVLDGRGWLVLSARQVSLDERASRAELARLLGFSYAWLRQVERLAEQRLREALDDPHFGEVASTAGRLRERLGEGPVPIGEARTAVDALTADSADRLDAHEFELLVWCAGSYDPVDDVLVLRGLSGSPRRRVFGAVSRSSP